MNLTKNNLNESKDLEESAIDIEDMREKLNINSNNLSGKKVKERNSPLKVVLKTGEVSYRDSENAPFGFGK